MLQDICLRAAKYKTDNKQLISYILFESENEQAYIQQIKDKIDEYFYDINSQNYIAYKSIRKILNFTAKSAKFSGILTTELELLIHFCLKFKNIKGIDFRKNTILINMYERVLNKIQKNINKLHEDVQFDYQQDLLKL